MYSSLRCSVVHAAMQKEYLAWDPALHSQLPASVQGELRVVMTTSGAVEESDYILNSLGEGASAESMARAINNDRRSRKLKDNLWYLDAYRKHLKVRQL